MSDSLQPHGGYPARLLCPLDFPGKNTGVDCLFLLQGVFLTQESNPHLLLGRWILYCWAPWEALSDCILGFSFFPDSTFPPPLLVASYSGGGQDRRTPYLFSCLNRLQGKRRGVSVPSMCKPSSMSPCHFNPNPLVRRLELYAAFCVQGPSCQGRTHQSKFFFNVSKLEHIWGC